MSKYVIEFSKSGIIKYTSHLDMVRLFKRTFKKAGIHLAHSQGFNPHPKMTFPLPLSLGYESNCELLEIEIDESKTDFLSSADIIERMNSLLPEGIRVNSCNSNNKNLASGVNGAEYLIGFPVQLKCGCSSGNCNSRAEADGLEEIEKFKKSYWDSFAEKFLDRDEIIVTKKAKAKRGKGPKKKPQFKEVNIKPMIKELNINMVNNNVFLQTKLDAGSTSNLSPELLMTAILEFSNLATVKDEIKYLRTNIYTD